MFLIGEFSKISQVSKRLLHHYDEIELLKPAYVDATTGYRYYSAKQFPYLNRILALKDLGLSLDQITQMLKDDITDDEIRGMLKIKKTEVEQSLAEDRQRLAKIEARLQQNQSAGESPDVVIKSVSAQAYLSTRAIFPNPEKMMQLAQSIHHTVPAKVESGLLGAFAAVVYSTEFSLINNDIALGFLLKKPMYDPVSINKEYQLQIHELPAVQNMATAVLVGVADPELAGLGEIAKWIEANNYRLCGPYREVVLELPDFQNLDETVVEIQIPVEKITALSKNVVEV